MLILFNFHVRCFLIFASNTFNTVKKGTKSIGKFITDSRMVLIYQELCPNESIIKKEDESTLEVLERSFIRATSRRFFCRNEQGKRRY